MTGTTWNRRRFLRAAGLVGLRSAVSAARRRRSRRLVGGLRPRSRDGSDAARLAQRPRRPAPGAKRASRVACLRNFAEPSTENGPAVFQRFGIRYQHWFDGDGMVQAFRFDGHGVAHRARVLATPKLARETSAGRRLFSGFGTPVDGSVRPVRPDDLNVANTSMLEHHGELLALWEGGSASVIDRDTLAWRGFKVWGESLGGLPFTAHPKTEADGTLWAFGCSFAPGRLLVLYHMAADGTVRKVLPIDVGPPRHGARLRRHRTAPGHRDSASRVRTDLARRADARCLCLAAGAGLTRTRGGKGRFRRPALVPAPGRIRLSPR